MRNFNSLSFEARGLGEGETQNSPPSIPSREGRGSFQKKEVFRKSKWSRDWNFYARPAQRRIGDRRAIDHGADAYISALQKFSPPGPTRE